MECSLINNFFFSYPFSPHIKKRVIVAAAAAVKVRDATPSTMKKLRFRVSMGSVTPSMMTKVIGCIEPWEAGTGFSEEV
jgi:hypothetical protein